jgi:hypothetical protein
VVPLRQCIQGWRGNCSDGGRAVPGTSRCRAHSAKGGWAAYGVKHPERAPPTRTPGGRLYGMLSWPMSPSAGSVGLRRPMQTTSPR